ncbi:hypothetical protein ABZ776_06630 [Streptomyces sp. NPDC007076]|uniref:hypothetical protein n=1 Tax=Streptomyces sp. NPDC007076 TaxID=3160975 RepID=UPI0033F6CA08
MRASDGSVEWLEDFITAWHGPRQPSYGLTETELPEFLPVPLQRLYRHAGRWPGPNPDEHLPDSPGIFQQQDVLVRAEALSLHEGTVEFLSENQDSWTCRVTAAGPAAPVVLSNAHWMWDDDSEDEYTPLTPSLEQFLTSFVLQETVFGCRNLATTSELADLPDQSVPLWLNGWYVFEEPSHSFWSVGSALVADISGTRWVGWNGPDTLSAELGKLHMIRS